MVLLVQCSSKIATPPSLPQPTSFLFEPNSLSLALTHSDSSLSFFPSSFPSFSNSQTLIIPPPCSSSSFLLLKQEQDPINSERVLFLAAGPHRGSSQVLLRVYILQRSNLFGKVGVFSNQKGIGFDPKLGVLLDIEHGVSVKVVGSVNFFAIYCVSSKKVWVFGVKLVAGDNGDDMVKLMRCAVVDCCAPVWSVSVSSGFLVLGEDGGVRVFNLRHLTKGKVRRVKGSSSELSAKVDGKALKLLNGITRDDNELNGSKEMPGCNGYVEGKSDKHVAPSKHKFVKCRQDYNDGGACFFAFKGKEVTGARSVTVKAISIQPLTTKKFMILDSLGDIYTLDLPIPVVGSSLKHMKHLPYNMRVKKLAVVPDVTSKSHTVWVSDGSHTVHKLALSVNDDGDDSQEELMQISVVKVIFTSERVQDFVPVAADILLILGQGAHICVCDPLKSCDRSSIRPTVETNFPGYSVVVSKFKPGSKPVFPWSKFTKHFWGNMIKVLVPIWYFALDHNDAYPNISHSSIDVGNTELLSGKAVLPNASPISAVSGPSQHQASYSDHHVLQIRWFGLVEHFEVTTRGSPRLLVLFTLLEDGTFSCQT